MLGIYCRTSKERDSETSTISQQRNIGIKFAEDKKLEYELYEDEGKSGYKISDDDLDPFNNRPSFTNLINDIKSGKIDKVWVWEHSRLSRNQYASAFIFNVFKKFKITLFENKKQFDINDPQIKFTMQILDAVSEYERELIVGRTSRGQKKQWEEGRRVHQKLFCYKKAGKDNKGFIIWEPVESEIETYNYMLKRYKEGASLRTIVKEVYDMNNIESHEFASYAVRMATVLRKYQYTGYQLTLEGLDIYKQFRKYKISSIQVLKDKKYWIKSIPYPKKLISINEWVDISERLQIRGAKMNFSNKERLLRATKDIGTGIINCGECNSRYYYKQQKSGNRKKFYDTYFHNQGFRLKVCNQKPRSFQIEDINNILKLFYFFFLVVYDNSNTLMRESQRNIKYQQIKIKENIKGYETEIKRIEKQISKFQLALDDTKSDMDTIRILAKNISQSQDKIDSLNIELTKSKIEYEKLSEKFSQNLLEITYYDVKEKIDNWFNKLNIEEQRNELIRVIKSCVIFNHYMIIDAGTVLFSFDILKQNKFDKSLLQDLNKDRIYKNYFINKTNRRKTNFFDTVGNISITDHDNKPEFLFIEIDDKQQAEKILKKLKIKYDIEKITKFVFFN
jgi:DNA invertase Pin-like site-specific DNA recombinase